MFENAKWITCPVEPERSSRLFRRDFTLGARPARAELRICALGLGVCTINGRPVTSDVFTTPFTRYDERVIYSAYDVTALLAPGENAIGVHVGSGFYDDTATTWNNSTATWRDAPKVIAELSVECEDGSRLSLATDATWRAAEGPCVYNQPRQGEIYDARLERVGFDKPGYDDSGWRAASPAHEPGGIFDMTAMPPVRIITALAPVALLPGNIYDFGRNIAGVARITLRGEAGREVTLKYDETLSPDGGLCGHINSFTLRENQPLHHEDHYILKGEGEEVYAPSFAYHGFRYVKVTNAPEDFRIEALEIHTDLAAVGSFDCSDEMLMKLHAASVNATLSNWFWVPTDCPHREQNGWTGDALLSAEQSLMNFDMLESYRKWLRDFKDVQRKNGQLPGIIPTTNWGYNWGSGPAWDSSLILIPLYVYENTGDASLIGELWENMERYMAYFERMSAGYIADFGLGDWCPPEDIEVCPSEVTDTAYLYADARAMARMASATGRSAARWEALAENTRAAWRKKFLPDESLWRRQTFVACAIYQGLLDESESAEAAEKLDALVRGAGYHLEVGILGAKYIFSALSQHGHADTLYKAVTNPAKPSYAAWILAGNTALCESWNMESSHNHHMFSEIDNWLYKHVAGINITASGVTIEPKFIDGISRVSASHSGVSVAYDEKTITVALPRGGEVILNGERRTVGAGTHSFRR